MKKGVLNRLKGVLGLLLITASIAGIIYWEQYGRVRLLYSDVLIARIDILPGTMMDKDNIGKYFTRSQREKSNLIKDSIMDSGLLLGQESTQLIKANAQISPSYFIDSELAIDDDQFIFRIPKDWLLTFPSSIRRRDEIFFYEIKPIDNKTTVIDSKLTQRKPLTSAIVAYVKDSANREVFSVDRTNRFDGTSKISEIEIIASIKQINALKSSYLKGNKMILLYN